jgi:hypothetical protein
VTTFRSLTLVIAVLLLAGGALTGIHLLNTNTTAPLPAQLSTADAGGQPAPAVPPVEQIPPAPDAPQTAQAPAGSAPSNAAPKSVPTNSGPAQQPTATQPDRTSDSGHGSDHDSDSDRWRSGDPGHWHGAYPDGFPRRDQYPFRDRQPGFGGQQPGFAGQQTPGQPGFGGQQPGFTGQQTPGQPGFGGQQPGFTGQQPGFTGQQTPGQPGNTPADRDRARQEVADALCDRYHIPRERCQIEPTAR